MCKHQLRLESAKNQLFETAYCVDGYVNLKIPKGIWSRSAECRPYLRANHLHSMRDRLAEGSLGDHSRR